MATDVVPEEQTGADDEYSTGDVSQLGGITPNGIRWPGLRLP